MGRDWDGRRRGDVDKSLSIQIHLSLDCLVSSSRMMGTGVFIGPSSVQVLF